MVDGLAKKYHTIPSIVRYEFDAKDTFHDMQILAWAEGEDDDGDDDSPMLGTAANPGVIDIPDWLMADLKEEGVLPQ